MIGASTDTLRPFSLERSQLRGRAVRLASTVDYVLGAHTYPPPVSALLGELLVLAGALAGGLKFAGAFSLQIRGEGPVRLLVADCAHDGQMRGYAGFDEAALRDRDDLPPMALLGKGVLALTLDQRATGGETYQGIVDLSGATLAECMRGYFERSEQVPTSLRLAVGRDGMTGRWQAGCIVVQATPGTRPGDTPEADEYWERARHLLASASDVELLDPHLPLDDLLFRLFHEDGVRVFEALPLFPGCSCDEERVVNVLKSFAPEDLVEMREVNGGITVTCQFCSRVYRFDRDAVDSIADQRRH